MKESFRWLTAASLFIFAAVPAFADNTPSIPASSANSAAGTATDPSQGFNFQVKAAEAYIYDTNPLRLVNGAHSLSGSDTTAEVILGDYTPIAKLSADTIVDQGFYNNSLYDTANLHEILDVSKATERWSAEVLGHVDYDTARTSDVTTFGVAVPNIRHTGLSLMPQASFNMTAIDKFSLSALADVSKYDNSALQDFSLYSVSPSYSRNLDPNNAALLILNAQHYQTDSGTAIDINTIGPSLGWTSIINKNLSTKLTAGVQQATEGGRDSGTNGGARLDWVFSANIAYKSLLDTANLTADRTEQPYGNGTAALVTSFKVDEVHQLNEKLALNAAASYSFSNYSAQSGVNIDDQIVGIAGITYNIFRNTDIAATYEYLNQTLTESAGTIKDQSVIVALKYHPPIGAIW